VFDDFPALRLGAPLQIRSFAHLREVVFECDHARTEFVALTTDVRIDSA
jgi:hypothetical protein